MNYKDPENRLLIACGIAGMLLIALLFRYFFIALGFDNFGANIVFLAIGILGTALFVSYIELIQRTISVIYPEEESIAEEKHNINSEKLNHDLIREKYRERESQQREEYLEVALRYTRNIFTVYSSNANVDIICEAITNNSNGIKIDIPKPAIVKDLSTYDLFHFGWNIWNHFKPARRNKQEDIAHFLKSVFAKSLKEVDIDTIRKKLTFNEGRFKIEQTKEL